MKKRKTAVGTILLALALSTFAGANLPAEEKQKGKSKNKSNQTATGLTCVRFTQEAAYRGLGYNHLVHLHNTCITKATCQVKTDVNPEPTEANLAPQQKKTVTTFLGSPARVFRAKVSCKSK